MANNYRSNLTENGRQIKHPSTQVIDFPKNYGSRTLVIKENRQQLVYRWKNGAYIGDIAKNFGIPIREADRIVKRELFGGRDPMPEREAA